MKHFIRNIIYFKIIILSVLCLISIINRVLLDIADPFMLDSDVNVVVLGDSHAKHAFNDRVLDETKSFANNADSYFYSYLKLKQLIKVNKQIRTVFLSFSKHNLNKKIEKRWLFNVSHLKDRLKLYLPLFETEDFLFLAKEKPADLISGFFYQLYFPVYICDGADKFGGYEELDENILKVELEKFSNGESFNDNVFIEADMEIFFLKKIVALCKTNDLEIVFFSTPLHHVLHNHQKELYGVYDKYFSDIPFLDYSKLELGDSCFIDLVHLNSSGAIIFSEKIKQEDLFFMN